MYLYSICPLYVYIHMLNELALVFIFQIDECAGGAVATTKAMRAIQFVDRIGQMCIADGLKVLHVNAMVCRRVLVLCGNTYPHRL